MAEIQQRDGIMRAIEASSNLFYDTPYRSITLKTTVFTRHLSSSYVGNASFSYCSVPVKLARWPGPCHLDSDKCFRRPLGKISDTICKPF